MSLAGWIGLAALVLAAAGLALRYAVKRPMIEVTIPDELWDTVQSDEFHQWQDEHRIEIPYFARRPTGELYLPFHSRRSADAFKERWLS